MRELTVDEVEMIDGAGGIDGELYGSTRYMIQHLPDAYRAVVMATTDLMCIVTRRC